jgi:hypothetical protein
MKIILSIFILALPAHAQSTLGEGDSYAWGGNIGWIEGIPNRPNTGDGFRFGEFACSGYLWSASTGWIHCGDGTPADGIQYANNSNTDYGVNHVGTGELSGMAWSANTGWINFGWWILEPNNPNRPRVNLQSGDFSGYAWSANCGWINLGTGILKTDSMPVTDSDNDGISDAYEIAYTGGLGTMTATSDFDKDGYSDQKEYLALTNPYSAQSFLKVTKVEKAAPLNGTATALTWTSSPARRYVIEGSNDLGLTQSWATSNLDPQSFSADAGSETTRTSNHPAADKRFFRVKPVIPLQP